MRAPNPRRDHVETWLLPLLVGGAIIALWQSLVSLTKTTVFPSPAAVARGIAGLIEQRLLLRYVGDSLFRISLGFGAATLLGIPIGLAMGWYPRMARILNPIIQILRPISPLAWIPVAIVLFGVTNGAAVFLIFLASFFPIAVAAMNAVRGVPDIYIRAARNFGLSTGKMFLRVVYPATLPKVLLGLRLALGVAWLVMVAAEMIAVDSGLGYLIVDARNAGKRYDLVVGGMLLIGLIGLVLDAGFRRLERLRWVRWGDRDE